MEENTKESDSTTSQQNNNSIETESDQPNCSTIETDSKIESKMVNNDSNGCDNGNSETTSPQTGNDNNHQDTKADEQAVTDMEMGSPEKQLASANDSKTSSNSPPKTESNANKEPNIDFKVIYNKKKYDISLPPDTDIGALKTHLQPIISIPPAMMKVMIKGLAKDEMTLKRLGVTKGSKIMIVGSSLNDVLQVSTTPKDQPKDLSTPKDTPSSSETCKQKQHKKV